MEKNEIIRLAGVGLGALAIGYTAGYLVSKHRFEHFVTEAVDSVKETYKEIYEQKGGDFAQEAPAEPRIVPGDVAATLRTYDGVGDSSRDEYIAEQIIAGRSLVDAVLGGEPSDAPAEMRPEVTNVFVVNPVDGGVYIISEEQFEEDMDSDFAKIEISFYAEDGVLADDSDMPVDNTNYLVGPEALSKFGTGSTNPDTVYVRNERMHTDWAVTRIHGSFHEIVLHQQRPAGE